MSSIVSISNFDFSPTVHYTVVGAMFHVFFVVSFIITMIIINFRKKNFQFVAWQANYDFKILMGDPKALFSNLKPRKERW